MTAVARRVLGAAAATVRLLAVPWSCCGLDEVENGEKTKVICKISDKMFLIFIDNILRFCVVFEGSFTPYFVV